MSYVNLKKMRKDELLELVEGVIERDALREKRLLEMYAQAVSLVHRLEKDAAFVDGHIWRAELVEEGDEVVHRIMSGWPIRDTLQRASAFICNYCEVSHSAEEIEESELGSEE